MHQISTSISHWVMFFVVFVSTSLWTQTEGGRAGFGFSANGAKYFGDFTDNSWWLGGDAFFKYNLFSELSLQAQFSYANPRFRVDVDNAVQRYTDYFGSTDPGSTHHNPDAVSGGSFLNGARISGADENNRNNTRIFSYELLAMVNLLPSQRFVPHLVGGIGLLSFQVRPGLAAGSGLGILPGQSAGLYSTNGINGGLVFPVGLGFELFLSDDVVFSGNAIYHFTSTKYLDDYNPGGMKHGGNPVGSILPNPSGVSDGRNDSYLTAGIGLTFYVFGTPDLDRDGISNGQERMMGTDEANADTDGDGLPDGYEARGLRNIPKGWTKAMIDQLPSTSFRPDPRKADTDDDSIGDRDELFKTKTNPTRDDTDLDGLNDAEEIARGTKALKPDSDNDGLTDGEEVNIYHSNPLAADTDSDKLGDGDEVRKYGSNPTRVDTDEDGLKDGDEINAFKTNPKSKDTDSDGLLDGEEVLNYRTTATRQDTDGDGLTDGEEVHTYKSNPTTKDSDGDRISDGDEVFKYKTSPANEDTDNDRLKDGDEIETFKTDPANSDTDGDSLKDGEEVTGVSALKYKTDPLLQDSDGDGLRDNKELELGTNPTNPDTDRDGIRDGQDACALTPGIPRDSAETKAGCPAPSKIAVGTKTDFPDILFNLNSDEFNYDESGTRPSLVKLLDYVNQCESLQVGVEGHASADGNAKKNQELSELRAKRVRTWLIEQGVRSSKVTSAIGYGSSQPKVTEPTPVQLKSMSKDESEAVRKQNRRITIVVRKSCD